MTKSLTEQWKDGELPVGTYYILDSEGQAVIDKSVCIGELWDNTDIKEVLAPVPSYDDVKEMSQKIERLKFDNEALEMAHNEGKEINAELVQKMHTLEQQLAEANEVIKFFADSKVGYENEDGTYSLYSQEELDKIKNGGSPFGLKLLTYDPRPAKKYLEKWGVK